MSASCWAVPHGLGKALVSFGANTKATVIQAGSAPVPLPGSRKDEDKWLQR